MKRTKAFMASFTITFCIMLMSFMAVYWYVGWSGEESVGKNQEGVPILSLTPEDTKTALVVLDCSDAKFYFLLQLNAIQNKVNLVSVPADHYLAVSQRTLAESMDYAGVRQCVQDLSRQFDLTIDYYLVTDLVQLAKLMDGFGQLDTEKVDIPQSIKSYLLKSTRFVSVDTILDGIAISPSLLDNSVGIEFLNLAGITLLQTNLEKMETVADNIKENYTFINTDMNTQDMDGIKRIIRLLKSTKTEFGRLVLTQETDSQTELDKLLKE